MREEVIAAAATKHLPAAGGAAGIILVGIPAGVLIAALLGAALSFYFRAGEPEPRIPYRIFGIVAMAFAGAWLSLALPHIDPISLAGMATLDIGGMAARIDPSVRAGLCALFVQSLWNFSHRLASRKVEGH